MEENEDKPSVIDLLDGPTEEAPTTEAEPTPEPEIVEKPAAFDHSQMASAFADALKTAGVVPQTPAKQQEPPMDPAEMKKLLNVWEPSDEWLQRYDNIDTRKAAIAEQRDAMLRQFDTVAQIRMQQMQREVQQQYAPLQEYIAKQDADAREARFNATFPVLSKAELIPLRDNIINGLAQRGAFAGKSETEIFNLIGKTFEATVQAANPGFKLTPQGSSPGGITQKKNGNALKAVTSGASGGAGGKSSADEGGGKSKVLQFL